MTTAIIISELLPIHDEALLADIDAAFDEIDREVAESTADTDAVLLAVEWLVDELLDTVCTAREPLEISLELTDSDSDSAPVCDEVAEVA
jgi:hypothetical protein